LKFSKKPIKNGDILIVTSKVLSITEGRTAKIKTEAEYDRLVEKEADRIMGKGKVTLTLKNGIFIPWAGIDRSNIQKGYAVLWPKNPFKSAQTLCDALKKKYGLKNFGVIISDSHCVPLRKGVEGIAIGYAGFKGVNDLRGHKDLFGNKLKVTQQNTADMMASAANLLMGEAAERTPFAIISGAPVRFTREPVNKSEPLIDPAECIFGPLYDKMHVCKRKKLKKK
jgi:dihydrofolate synthase / folylpolyglutamate synthase